MEKYIWRILQVDDDEDDFFLTRSMLAEARQGKFILEWASTYEKGRQMILEGGYDAVLMDYDLGARTGIDLIRDVFSSGYDTPILLLTGRGTFDIDVAAMQAGVADYINKGEVTAAFLERSIRYAIERRRNQQALARANAALEHANASLAASRRDLSEFLESINDGFLVLDRSWKFVYVNSRAAQRLRSDPVSLVGRSAWEQFHGRTTQPLGRFIQNVMDTHQSGFLEYYDESVSRQWYGVSAYPSRQGVSILFRNQTEQKTAEQAVQRERAFLQTTLDQMLSGVVIAEAPGGRVITCNQQVDVIWRQPIPMADDIAGYTAYNGFNADGSPLRAEDWPLARAILKGELVRGEEITIRRGDGSMGVILVNANPVTTPNGEMTAAVMTFFDITERKRGERDTLFLIELAEVVNRAGNPTELLEAVTERVARHLESSRCLMYRVDGEAQSLVVAQQYHGVFPPLLSHLPLAQVGDSALEELRAGRPVIIRDMQSPSPVAQPMLRYLQDYGVASCLAVPLMHGGELAAALSLADNRPRNWNERQIALLQSIAERTWAAYETQRLVEALRASEERSRGMADYARLNLQKLETVIDSMSEAVMLSTPEGLYTRVNPAAVALFGCRSEPEVMREAQFFEELYEISTPAGHPIGPAEIPHNRAIRGETVINFEIHVQKKDAARQFAWLFSCIPVRGLHSDITFILTTITDISQIRRTEQERGELNARLSVQHLLVEQREQERLQIARDLHDGPIQNLIGLVFSLQSAAMVTAEEGMLEILNAVRDDAQRLVAELRGVCNQLRPPMLDKFGLAKAIRAFADDLRDRYPGLTLELSLDESDPQIGGDVRLALYRIFQESINNVIRHAQATLAVVTLALLPDAISLSIEDNGRGFSLPDDWLTLAREGHLGLVGIKERAEAIGAEIDLRSAPGQGTTIRVTLPR